MTAARAAARLKSDPDADQSAQVQDPVKHFHMYGSYQYDRVLALTQDVFVIYLTTPAWFHLDGASLFVDQETRGAELHICVILRSIL